MRKVLSFSFDEEKDEEVIKYLKSLSNRSKYVADLVRADLDKKDDFTENQKEKIRDIIKEYLSTYEISLDKVEKKEEFDPDVIDAISDNFGF